MTDTPDTRDPARRAEMGLLAWLEEHKTYWTSQDEHMVGMLFDIAIAAERRRHTNANNNHVSPDSVDWVEWVEAINAEDAALVALAAHLSGASRSERN